MSVPAPVRQVATVVRRHRLATGIVAVFAAAALGVSLATTTTPQHSYPAAPAFSVAALGTSGQHISLSQYRGKPLIVNFWASWCEPCQQETPLLASWYKQQHGRVILVGLDENDSAAKALSFARAKGVDTRSASTRTYSRPAPSASTGCRRRSSSTHATRSCTTRSVR